MAIIIGISTYSAKSSFSPTIAPLKLPACAIKKLLKSGEGVLKAE